MIKPFLQLFRLPNVFTAIADVMMGYLFTHAEPKFGGEFLLLVAGSALLYTAGMVLNDVFDVEVDRKERPERPLPSGRIRLGTAKRLGFVLLGAGLACGWLAGALAPHFQFWSGLVATVLVGMILLYDIWLKSTPLGPLAMGACRMLNVLLGISAASWPWETNNVLIAAAIGVYIVGLTWYARTEAMMSNRRVLIAATLVLAIGMAMLGHLTRQQDKARELAHIWPWLWLVLGGSIAGRFVQGVLEPTPERVQQAIKMGIMSLIVLDAVVAFSAVGQTATIILLLWIPALALGRWVYST
jgi:4-hydroxybenzoate polyprenyltransferase